MRQKRHCRWTDTPKTYRGRGRHKTHQQDGQALNLRNFLCGYGITTLYPHKNSTETKIEALASVSLVDGSGQRLQTQAFRKAIQQACFWRQDGEGVFQGRRNRSTHTRIMRARDKPRQYVHFWHILREGIMRLWITAWGYVDNRLGICAVDMWITAWGSP